MGKTEPRTLPGFMELLPSEQILFDDMKQKIEKSYQKFGFLPIDTPIIEYAEVLLAKAGGETEKQIYRFEKDIVLRPIWAFLKIYILNLGFLDGKLGFIFSMNHYMYTMMKYTKLYYLYKSDGKL